MNRINVTLLALVCMAMLVGCGRGQMKPAREVDVEGQFAISIPANLVPCNDLHEFAQLQVADERSGYYLVGIMEPKAGIAHLSVRYELGDYADFVETTIGSAFDTMHVSQRDTLEINGMQCHSIDFFAAVTAEQAPLEVYYHLSIFESESHFYQLIGWTYRDRQEAFAETVREIEHSFHELSGELAVLPQ